MLKNFFFLLKNINEKNIKKNNIENLFEELELKDE